MLNYEALSSAESLAQRAGKPEKLFVDPKLFGVLKTAIVSPSPNISFNPWDWRPNFLTKKMSREQRLGQMNRLLAACGDSADNRGENYKELMKSVHNDPVMLVALLIFPDNRNLRGELYGEIYESSNHSSSTLDDYLLISPGEHEESNLLVYGLRQMAQKRAKDTKRAEDRTGKEITVNIGDSRGKNLKFYPQADEKKLVLSAPIVTLHHPEVDHYYTFDSFESIQETLRVALGELTGKHPETDIEISLQLAPEQAPEDEIDLGALLGPMVKRLNKDQINLLIEANNPIELARDLVLYDIRHQDSITSIPIKNNFVVSFLALHGYFEDFGWSNREAALEKFEGIWEEVEPEVKRHLHFMNDEDLEVLKGLLKGGGHRTDYAIFDLGKNQFFLKPEYSLAQPSAEEKKPGPEKPKNPLPRSKRSSGL